MIYSHKKIEPKAQISHSLIADLANLEQATLSSNIALLEFVSAVLNGGTASAGKTVVVHLTDSANDRDTGLGQEVGSKVWTIQYNNDDACFKQCKTK
jgi:hypothetical protein